ncbi:MAG: metallophosphoesterase family protein [Thermoanaerobaculales bacterium]
MRRAAKPTVHRIGVISDTHGLLRREALAALVGCELIVHAGDVGGREVLDRLRAVAPVVAVRGNVDIDDWARSLPETETLKLGDVSLNILHDLDKLDLDPAAAGFAAVIFGHSHRCEATMRDGVLYLNPGSAGPRRFRLPVSVARLQVVDAQVSAELVTLLT